MPARQAVPDALVAFRYRRGPVRARCAQGWGLGVPGFRLAEWTGVWRLCRTVGRWRGCEATAGRHARARLVRVNRTMDRMGTSRADLCWARVDSKQSLAPGRDPVWRRCAYAAPRAAWPRLARDMPLDWSVEPCDRWKPGGPGAMRVRKLCRPEQCEPLKRQSPAGRGSVFDLAVREGFEPSIRFLVYTLSRRAPSTARTPHRISPGLRPSRRANVAEQLPDGKKFFSFFMRLRNGWKTAQASVAMNLSLF